MARNVSARNSMSLLTAIAFLALSIPAQSAGLSSGESLPPPDVPVEEPQLWEFTIAPYVWGAGVSGDVAQFGLPVTSIDQSFADILRSLEFAGMVVAGARYDRFSVSTDLSYVVTSSNTDTPYGVLANSVGVTTSSLRWAAVGGYEVFDNNRLRIDLHAGLQLLSAETKIALSGGLLGGTTRTDGRTWVDGLGGVIARLDLTPRIYMSSWAYAGAGQSDLVWDVMAGGGYSFNDHASLFIGYRANGADYQDGSFIYDVVQHGPVSGLVFKF